MRGFKTILRRVDANMPDDTPCPKEVICCPPPLIGYVACETPNLFSASTSGTFTCEGQPDLHLTGRGVSSISQEDADAKAEADMNLQLAIARSITPCEEGCNESSIAEIIACGDQNWPAGPQTGIPYSNSGDNVTDFITIAPLGDLTTDGSKILGTTSDPQANQLPSMVGNNFVMTGDINLGWSGEGAQISDFYWMILDADNKRGIGFQWGPRDTSHAGYQGIVFCDFANDFFTNSPITGQDTDLTANSDHTFIFSFTDGVLNLQLDDEPVISIDVGCPLFGKVVLAFDNESGFDSFVSDINVT